jgi:hypothetical protein
MVIGVGEGVSWTIRCSPQISGGFQTNISKIENSKKKSKKYSKLSPSPTNKGTKES